jgi:hypothetical protein
MPTQFSIPNKRDGGKFPQEKKNNLRITGLMTP